jgi:hypothetical protein
MQHKITPSQPDFFFYWRQGQSTSSTIFIHQYCVTRLVEGDKNSVPGTALALEVSR